MKKVVSLITVLGLSLGALAMPLVNEGITAVELIEAGAENGIFTANFDVEYLQSDARSMLTLVNEFRTGTDAWAWNSSNSDKVYYSGLGELTYDYELEKVAMLRAAELVAEFEHQRPNGEYFYTAYTPSFSSGRGENISIGMYNPIDGAYTAEETFYEFLEEDENYSGQGHRRNMLGSYNSIGIAGVYYKGCYYWVQEFANNIVGETETAANDFTTNVSVDISENIINTKLLSPSYDSASLTAGESMELPSLIYSFRTSKMWEYAPAIAYDIAPEWSVNGDDGIINISDGKITALRSGTVMISAQYEGTEISIPVTVKAKAVTPPKGVTVSFKANSTSAVYFTWTRSADAEGYEIKLYKNGKWSVVSDTAKNAYKIVGLDSGRNYIVAVKPYKMSEDKKVYGEIAKMKCCTKPASSAALYTASYAKAAVTASWKKVVGASGYQVHITSSPALKNGVYINTASTRATKTKLVSKKVYYVRVRAYTTLNGNKYYGVWGMVKKIKSK